MVLQPERAFEVEIVGRLVEQQQVGLREQRRGERDAHAPAAGKFRAWPLLIGGGEAEAGEDRCRAGRGRVRADIGEPGLDLGDAMRVVRGFRLGQQRGALAMRLQHDLDQAFRPVRRFLRQPADAPARRDLDVALLGGDIAGDDAEQSGLAGAVAADQADARARRNARGGAFQQRASGNADREIVDDEHAAPFGRRRGAKQAFRGLTDIEHEIEPAGETPAGVRDPHQQCTLKEAITRVRRFVWKIELRGEETAAQCLNLDVIVPCAAGIDRWRDGTETKSAVGPGGDMAAISEAGIVVFALVVRMPEVDHSAAKRATGSRQHKAGKLERTAAGAGFAKVAALR